MTDQSRSSLRALLLALTAFGIFATHDVVVKYLGDIYAPFQIVFFSVLFGFPIVVLMLIRDHSDANLRPRHPWWTGLRTIAAVITGFCAFYAFSVLPLAQAYALLFAAPLVITVLSIPVLGEAVGIRRWSAVVIGLLGVMVVLQPGTSTLGLGHAAGVTAALGSGLASIIVRKIGRDERSVVLMLYPMMGNFILMAAILPFVYKPMPLNDLGAVAMIAVLGFIGTFCLISAYKLGEAVLVAPMQYSQILWAAVYGALFFEERIDAVTLLGAVIIIASGLYIVLRESGKGTETKTPVLNTASRTETGTIARVSTVERLRQDRNT